MLDRQWAALKVAGMLVSATLTPVTTGVGIAADVIYDAPGAVALENLSVVDHSVRFRTADWASARSRDTVTIGVLVFEVSEVVALDDGLVSRAMLRRRS